MKSTSRSDKMNCPLAQREIAEELCADAILVAEDFHPERFAPQELRNISNWKEFCRNCKNNPYNEE